MNKPATQRHLSTQTDANSISFLLMRQIIGILGILLPIALIIGNRALGNEHWMQASISHYYYSYMHIAFVGVLCILGAVLISYREGQHKWANIVSTFAGFSALGVAIFPTDFDGFMGQEYFITTAGAEWFTYVHFGSAFLLFACFVVFCFKMFQESDDKMNPNDFDDKKNRRNKIYKASGWGIIVSVVLIVIGFILKKEYPSNQFSTYSTFIFETTALLCFGNSWLLKGSRNWKNSDKKLLRIMALPVR
jgi:hypothetical protein